MGGRGRLPGLLRARSGSRRSCPSRAPARLTGSRHRNGRSPGRGRPFLYHPGDVRTNRAARRAARDQRPDPRLALRVHRRLRPGRLALRDARAGRASPTSWSTSRSRGRRPTRRPGRSPRRSRASAAASTPPPTASRPSTGSACPAREAQRAADVVAELIVRPRLEDDEIDHERSVIVEEIRSYLDDPSEYAQILIQQAMFGDGPLGREICGDEEGDPEPAAVDDPRLLGGHLPAVERRRGDRRRPRPRRRRSTSSRRRSGPATGSRPRSSTAPRAARRPAVPARQPRHGPGPHLPGRAGLPARPPGLVDARRAQRGPRRGDEQPPVPVRPRGARAGLRRRARGSPSTPTAARSGSTPGSTRTSSSRRSRRSWPSWPGCATSDVPADELAKAKAYLSGGLELRMDDTRHLASWIGGQEALHDRVLTLDEALEAVAAVTADDIRRVAGELFRDDRAPARRRRAARPRARPRPRPPAAGLTGRR